MGDSQEVAMDKREKFIDDESLEERTSERDSSEKVLDDSMEDVNLSDKTSDNETNVDDKKYVEETHETHENLTSTRINPEYGDYNERITIDDDEYEIIPGGMISHTIKKLHSTVFGTSQNSVKYKIWRDQRGLYSWEITNDRERYNRVSKNIFVKNPVFYKGDLVNKTLRRISC